MARHKALADGYLFYSKRNTVVYDKVNKCVRKTFGSKKNFLEERLMYEKLLVNGQVNVPRLLGVDGVRQSLSIEFLEGDTLLEVLMEDEINDDVVNAVSHMGYLFDWLDTFYMIAGDKQVKKDVNFRNFIFTEGQLYGIDFEGGGLGDRHREQCMVFAMYLLYDPVETSFKAEVCQKVIAQRSLGDIYPCIYNCMEEIYDRRCGKPLFTSSP